MNSAGEVNAGRSFTPPQKIISKEAYLQAVASELGESLDESSQVRSLAHSFAALCESNVESVFTSDELACAQTFARQLAVKIERVGSWLTTTSAFKKFKRDVFQEFDPILQTINRAAQLLKYESLQASLDLLSGRELVGYLKNKEDPSCVSAHRFLERYADIDPETRVGFQRETRTFESRQSIKRFMALAIPSYRRVKVEEYRIVDRSSHELARDLYLAAEYTEDSSSFWDRNTLLVEAGVIVVFGIPEQIHGVAPIDVYQVVSEAGENYLYHRDRAHVSREGLKLYQDFLCSPEGMGFLPGVGYNEG